MTRQYRQGDLLVIECPEAEPLDKPPAQTDILIEGSMTGHKHRLSNSKIYARPLNNDGDFAIIVTGPGAVLSHDEHRPVPIPEGTWVVRRQKEVGGFVED